MKQITNETRNPNWGGKREGSGRKPTGRSKHMIYVTDQEYEKIVHFLWKIRQQEISN